MFSCCRMTHSAKIEPIENCKESNTPVRAWVDQNRKENFISQPTDKDVRGADVFLRGSRVDQVRRQIFEQEQAIRMGYLD